MKEQWACNLADTAIAGFHHIRVYLADEADTEIAVLKEALRMDAHMLATQTDANRASEIEIARLKKLVDEERSGAVDACSEVLNLREELKTAVDLLHTFYDITIMVDKYLVELKEPEEKVYSEEHKRFMNITHDFLMGQYIEINGEEA